jgi:hypothetical protein
MLGHACRDPAPKYRVGTTRPTKGGAMAIELDEARGAEE